MCCGGGGGGGDGSDYDDYAIQFLSDKIDFGLWLFLFFSSSRSKLCKTITAARCGRTKNKVETFLVRIRCICVDARQINQQIENFYHKNVSRKQRSEYKIAIFTPEWIRIQIFSIFNFVCLCHLQGPTEIKRATTDKLREVFQKYASQQRDGEHFMTSEDFIRGYLGLFPESNFNKASTTVSICGGNIIIDGFVFRSISGFCDVVSGYCRYKQRWTHFVRWISSIRRAVVYTGRLVQNCISIVRYERQWNGQLRWILSGDEKDRLASTYSIRFRWIVCAAILRQGKTEIAMY